MQNALTAFLSALAFTIAASTFESNMAVAQNAQPIINTAEIDVVPGKMDQFLAALKENALAAINEPGCREFNVMVSKNDPNHVFTFVIFDGPAALDAHRATDAYKKFREETKGMIAKNANRQFVPVALNKK